MVREVNLNAYITAYVWFQCGYEYAGNEIPLLIQYNV